MLIEQTNREGLVDNEFKEALFSLLQKVLEDFKTFSQNIEDGLRQEDLTSIDVLKRRVTTSKTEVQKRIRQIAVDAPEQEGPLREGESIVTYLADQIEGVDEVIATTKEDRPKLHTLRGTGNMCDILLPEPG